MILKSFWRKKNVKIYALIFIILFIVLFLLSGTLKELTKIKNKYFVDNTLLYLESNNDKNEQIEKIDGIINVNKIAIVDNISSKILPVDILTESNLNKIMIYNSKSKNLNLGKNEVVVFLNELNYKNYKDEVIKLINTPVFEINSTELVLIDVISTQTINCIAVSDDLFLTLLDDSKFHFVANIVSEDKISYVMERLIDLNFEKVDFYENVVSNDYQKQLIISNTIKNLKFANIVLIIIFFIIVIIVDLNMISDLKKDFQLEKRFGCSNLLIMKNLFVRILTLHFFSIFNSVFVSIIIGKFITKSFNYSFEISFDNLSIYILVLFCDLLLCLIVNNKSNLFKRR